MARRVKYMGAADIRIINAGDDFGGTLQKGLPATLRWDWKNRHIVDVEAAGLSKVQIEVLLDYEGPEGPEFRDVTNDERIPVNRAQMLWRGAKPDARLSEDEELPGVDTAELTDEERKRNPTWSGGSVTSEPVTPDPAGTTAP